MIDWCHQFRCWYCVTAFRFTLSAAIPPPCWLSAYETLLPHLRLMHFDAAIATTCCYATRHYADYAGHTPLRCDAATGRRRLRIPNNILIEADCHCQPLMAHIYLLAILRFIDIWLARHCWSLHYYAMLWYIWYYAIHITLLICWCRQLIIIAIIIAIIYALFIAADYIAAIAETLRCHICHYHIITDTLRRHDIIAITPSLAITAYILMIRHLMMPPPRH